MKNTPISLKINPRSFIMLTETFYDILDSEIDDIIDRYKDHPDIPRHKDKNQEKAYAFMVWFLEFYGRLSLFKKYITDGHGDASCDIIFDRPDSRGNIVFYVVQAKWCSRKNALGNIKSGDVKHSLNDFETIIRGDKQKTRNEKFNEKYEALQEHLKKNGKVKFIFLALTKGSNEYLDNVKSFNNNNKPNEVEIIDIERIKRDYIDLKYKGIRKVTPLEIQEYPDNSKIILQIERFADVPGKGDIIKKSDIHRAYIVMVKPRVIHELFERFGFSLFYRNVRNPLPESNYNVRIANTLKDAPEKFWYFNNGITAISRSIPEIGNEAREIEITGLQVINGAQTVYTVYSEYEKAPGGKQEEMDRKVLIMLRLVDSSDKDFNLEVTRYTNSQNPMVDRDFQANEDDQVRLQNESFNDIYWYEKRRGEFRQVPEGICIIENQTFAAAYLAFFKEDIHGAIFKNHLIFIKRENGKDEGVYETIFNEYVKFADMLASYLLVEQILDFIHPNLIKKEEGKPVSWDFHDERFLLALAIAPLFKLVFTEYLSMKFNQTADQVNLTNYLRKNRIEDHIFDNIYMYIIHHLNLIDSKGKVDLKALKGKEAITQIVDKVNRKKTDELEQLLYIRKLGVQFFEQDNPEKFSSSLKSLIPPEIPGIRDPNAYKLLDDVLRLREEGKSDTAIHLFESIDRIEPGNWYIFKEWGITYKEIKDYDNATKKLGKALELANSDRDKSGIYTELGVVYREKGELNEALAAFEIAENLDRENADLYDKWAYLYYNMGKYQEAMNKMTTAVKLYENNEVYKWKFEYYSKRFSDNNFRMGLGKFLALKMEEKPQTRRSSIDILKASPVEYNKKLYPSASNNPENFEWFVKRHKPKEIIEGEIIQVDSDLGIFVGFDIDVFGLIRPSRLPRNFDVNDSFKVGKKIKVILLFIKYDKYQVELDIAR